MNLERIPSGIMGLDELIGGGFQKGKTYLISGEAGTGKTIFCLQFTLEGLMNGKNTVYLTIDERPAHLVQDAATFGWDLDEPIRKKRLNLIDITPEFSELRMGKFKGDVENQKILDEIRDQVKKVKAERVVIDPIAPMFASSENQFQLREYIRQLMFSLDELGTTNLVSSIIDTGSNMISKFGVEEFFASGVIVLWMEREEMAYNRVMMVRKMRGTPIDLRVRKFTIDSKTGITLYG
ncbi:MAG: AAA family ATPase [Candidatus Bathyarchaeota archaeon]|nr:AAA family ATPase [Candidatus Bathyarchaeota archaeon]